MKFLFSAPIRTKSAEQIVRISSTSLMSTHSIIIMMAKRNLSVFVLMGGGGKGIILINYELPLPQKDCSLDQPWVGDVFSIVGTVWVRVINHTSAILFGYSRENGSCG